METIEVKLAEGIHTLEVRQGDSLPLHEPQKVDIAGNIDSVTRFLEKRVSLINQNDCHIKVSRKKNDMSIILITDESSFYSGKVTGKVILAEDFIEFGINIGKKYGLRDLSDFIKMHRHCFEDPGVAMKLVPALRNFKAKVNQDIENTSDKRGNQKVMLDQVVDSNVPEAFILQMPIFKGTDAVKFKVEINISPRDVEMDCTLESPEANDLLILHRDSVIDQNLNSILSIAPNIVQIEI